MKTEFPTSRTGTSDETFNIWSMFVLLNRKPIPDCNAAISRSCRRAVFMLTYRVYPACANP